ncbi:hypothetical protein [Thermomonospora umbrina]|uniref:Uncharacterized protein n=1 Tax=Thermomonospora umbrina TaxID=111806 RepID=A0A3D9T2T5_9ACTN|nr:hypothetical protein [Thermomonospora umbrina]REF00674.1 hypothetical protein DFJ69_6231 [Thermomonospora umbrina]
MDESARTNTATAPPQTAPYSEAEPRHTALQELAGLLRGQGYTAKVERLHLTVTDGDEPVEVWAQRRPNDENRLWFAWAGGGPMCPADQPQDAVVAVKAALHQIPARM